MTGSDSVAVIEGDTVAVRVPPESVSDIEVDAVADRVAVGKAVAEAVMVGVGGMLRDGVGTSVSEAVSSSDFVGIGVSVGMGVFDAVSVRVGSGVSVGVGMSESDTVSVATKVSVRVGGAVGVVDTVHVRGGLTVIETDWDSGAVLVLVLLGVEEDVGISEPDADTVPVCVSVGDTVSASDTVPVAAPCDCVSVAVRVPLAGVSVGVAVNFFTTAPPPGVEPGAERIESAEALLPGRFAEDPELSVMDSTAESSVADGIAEVPAGTLAAARDLAEEELDGSAPRDLLEPWTDTTAADETGWEEGAEALSPGTDTKETGREIFPEADAALMGRDSHWIRLDRG